jgi:hypothetical protein
MKLKIVWDPCRASQSELSTRGRKNPHDAIDDGRAIIEDNLRAQKGSSGRDLLIGHETHPQTYLALRPMRFADEV